mmetsp:Transcript_42538/g.85333  ORF Transcript_42538/g.85333 Transcript_42538/m.85333 type:complete len:94 (+) Transcript_42538:75-356(+)
MHHSLTYQVLSCLGAPQAAYMWLGVLGLVLTTLWRLLRTAHVHASFPASCSIHWRLASAMMSAAALRTSSSVVCRPVLSRRVPTAYSWGTSIA